MAFPFRKVREDYQEKESGKELIFSDTTNRILDVTLLKDEKGKKQKPLKPKVARGIRNLMVLQADFLKQVLFLHEKGEKLTDKEKKQLDKLAQHLIDIGKAIEVGDASVLYKLGVEKPKRKAPRRIRPFKERLVK